MSNSQWEYFGNKFDLDLKAGELMIEYSDTNDGLVYEIIRTNQMRRLYEALKGYYEKE